MMTESRSVTRVLEELTPGDPRAVERLMPLVYDELRTMAKRQMRQERDNHTLQPTALVNEAFMRLLGDGDMSWTSRGYFFAAAGEAMRRILVEHARGRKRIKRRGAYKHLQLDDIDTLADHDDEFDWLALDEALLSLQAEDERLGDLVRLRFFAGLTVAQTAAALNVTDRTVRNRWRYARAFLFKHMNAADSSSNGEVP